MEIKFSRIEVDSKKYLAFMTAIGLVAALAPASAICLFLEGHRVTNMTNQVPWGMPIVMAIYLIGASAGSLVLSAMSSVFGRVEFKPFARMAATLAAILIVAALASIILDWGRPDRLMIPFFHFQPRSVFSLNAILYSSYMLLCLVYLWAMFNGKKHLERLLGLTAVFLAVLVHSGTGAIFGFVYVRELYGSPLLPPSFIAAALSSGTALMIIILYYTFRFSGRYLDPRLLTSLGKLMGVFIIVVLYFLFVENITRSYAPANYEESSFLLLHGGKYTALFWIGLVGLGMIVPMIVGLNHALSRNIPLLLGASVLQLAGVLIERFIIVIPAQVFPVELFHDQEVSSVFLDGQFADYSVSLIEWTYSAGMMGAVVFLFALVIRLWPMVPTEARHLEPEEELAAGKVEETAV